MDSIHNIISMLFSLALIFNALIFIPQASRIVKEKSAAQISIATFMGFLITQLIAVLYGYMRKDYILISGYLLSMVTCGTVIILAIYYRNKKEHKKELLDVYTKLNMLANNCYSPRTCLLG